LRENGGVSQAHAATPCIEALRAPTEQAPRSDEPAANDADDADGAGNGQDNVSTSTAAPDDLTAAPVAEAAAAVGTSAEQQLLQQRFVELTAAVQCSNSLEWAVLHGDSDQAYQAMHESATALLEAPVAVCEPPAKAEGGTVAASGGKAGETAAAGGWTVLAGLLASKAREWRTRVVLCAIHLLERDQRWDDALHYLEILLGITNNGNDIQQQPQQRGSDAAGGGSHTRVAAHQRGSVPTPANVFELSAVFRSIG